MSSSHVQVAPDGSGKDIDTDALVSTESGNPTVYRQDVVIADPTTYTSKAAVEGDAFLNRIITRDPVTAEEQLKVLYLIAKELSAIRLGISQLVGQPLFTDDDRLQSGLEKAH